MKHGGGSPQAKRKAKERIIEQGARKALQGVVFEPVTDPLRALSEVAGELIAVKDWLRGHVDELENIRTLTIHDGEQVRAELAAYMQSLSQVTNTLASIARLNIDERLVRIEEQQKIMIIEALRAGLNRIGVAPAEQAKALAETGRHLRVAA